MYSILGRSSFCFNYFLNSAWHFIILFYYFFLFSFSPIFIYIYSLVLCFIAYVIFIFYFIIIVWFFFDFPLSGPVPTYISLLIIPCMIVYVTNNKEPWTLDMEVISLWHCWGGMEAQVSLTVAFSSSVFFGLLFLIFLLTLPHIFSMFRSGEFAGQSSTPTPWSSKQLLVLLAVWAGAKSCWKMNSASLKSSRRKHEVPKNLLVNGCSDAGFHKTQWTNTSRWHYTPNHHRLWKLNTGLQATWAMSFSTLPPDSRTLVSKWNTKLALIWKEDFGPLGNSPVLLLLSPGKTPLTTTVAKFLDTSVCGGSWCLDPSLSPFLVKFTQILE